MKKITLFILLCFFSVKSNAQCWKSLSAGQSTTVGVKTDGTLWSFGGILGIGGNYLTPTQIGTANNWESVSMGNIFCLAIKTDGTLWGFGIAAEGQFGNGILVNGFPVSTQFGVQIGTQNNWKKVFCSSYASFAIKTNGTLWSTGNDYNEILGNGLANGNQTTFTQVGTDTNWASISCNSNSAFVLALKTNGERWAWGDNSLASLGDGSVSNKYVPTHAGTDTWKSVSNTSGAIGFGIKTNGTLWNWGGSGNTSLNQIGTANNWETITCGVFFQVATKTNGDLLTWGNNNFGQLGDGTNNAAGTPVLITNNTWQIVAAGANHTIVQNASGTYSWGKNDSGQIGDGTIVNKFVPTLISCPVLASESFNINNKINIYPNPNNGNFFIKTNETDAVNEIKIYNMQGKLLFTKNTITNNEEIQTSGFAQGIYIVNLEMENGFIINQKMVVE